YESMVFERFPNRILITETDRDIFPHPDRNQISIVPNGVDLEYFKPNQSLKTHDIIFAGNMNYPPNVDAVLFLLNDIMPIVWKRKPQTKVLIAGANPAASIRQKASDLVEITGWVDDISEAYSSARIFVAPMRIGTGLQNKLLEAMASGLPCITSPLAFRPLKATKNIDVLVAETADDYANLIVELIDNHIFWEICSLQGRKFVEKNYSWKTVGNQLNDLFTSSV
ncbi:MAG: glycosyltransferase, partial [Bacteroidales bacterium]|nr:glycosyltransferase [Bacteroidales bacterium]